MLDEVTFSQQLRHSGGHVQFSPNGKYLAIALEKRVVVRNPRDLSVVVHHSCIDNINILEWAPNSELFLCATSKKSVVHVFSVSDHEWHCRVKEGLAGLTSAKWSPDSLHILTFSDFNLHLTFWSLVTQNMFVIRQPKGCVAFSSDDEVMAVVTRKNCKDWITLYQLREESWNCENEFQLETLDVASIEFLSDNSSIVVLDTELHYMVQVYSLDGVLLAKYQAYDDALGIKSVSLSPSGVFVAVGSYDQSIRLISSLTWKPILVYNHENNPKQLPASSLCTDVAYHSEIDENSAKSGQNKENSDISNSLHLSLGTASIQHTLKASSKKRSGFPKNTEKSLAKRSHAVQKPHATNVTFIQDLPSNLPTITPDYRKSNPRLGVGLISWSHDGKYLASRNDNMPSVLWIWDTQGTGLRAAVVFLEQIKSMKWQPQQHSLAVCTGNQRLYFWNPTGVLWLDAPDGFEVHGMRWSRCGSMISLLAKDKTSICYME